MRKLVLALLLLAAGSVRAQTQTNVTATVVDPLGIPYANGTYSIQLIPTGTNPSVNGQGIGGAFNGSTDANGRFNVSLWPNASIVPGGTTWQIVVCTNPGGVPPPLGTGNQCTPPTAFTIAGASQDLSSALDAIAPRLTLIGSGGGGIIGGTIGVNQVAFGTAPNTIGGSNNFTFNSTNALIRTGTCGLTAVATFTACGDGLGATTWQGAPSVFEFVTNTQSPWLWTATEADAPGNTGATRQDFIGLFGGNDGSFVFEHVIAGTPATDILFDVPASRLDMQALDSTGLNALADIEVQTIGGTLGEIDESVTGGIFLNATAESEWTVATDANPAHSMFLDFDVVSPGVGQINLDNPVGPIVFSVLSSSLGFCVNSFAGIAGCFLPPPAGTPASMELPEITPAKGSILRADGSTPTLLEWLTNCSSSASPAVCGSAAAGSVAIAAAATTVTVDTTEITANSQVLLATDDTLGTKLGVTCNSTTVTLVGGLTVTARTPGISFQITSGATPAVNPLCISYLIVN